MPKAPTNLTKSKPASLSRKSPHANRFTPAALKAFRVNVRSLRSVAVGRMPCSICQGGRRMKQGRRRRGGACFRVNQ